jgi:hypothetical protein
MSRKDFFKNYGDAFTPDEQKWVPKYSNDYIKMCGYCPKKLAETCHEELDISGVYHDDVIDTEDMRWCCHARFILSASMSDGTVPFEVGKKVQKRAEEITKKQGIKIVTTINTTNAFADLAKDFSYKKVQENPPEPKGAMQQHVLCVILTLPNSVRSGW